MSRPMIAAIASTLLLSAAVFQQPARADLIIGVTTTNILERFDSSTPGTLLTSVGLTGLQSGETILGIDIRPANGLLYGLGSTSRLYLIDPVTGVATQVGSAGAFALSGTSFGFDFNPVVDRIRVTSDGDQDLRLNPNDGTLVATDTPLAFVAGDPNFGANPNVTGSAYANNFGGAQTTTLYDIDSNLDILVMQNPANLGALNTVGALGFNTSSLVGFDISSAGIAFASLTAPSAGASQLFTVNLATGAATLVGTIGGGVPLSSLAVALSTPVPEPASLALVSLALASIAVMRRRRSAKPARADSQ